jgi:uncharacterized protein YaiI (UPF0178 family)
MIEPPLILVDADACPVKEEIYKVAFRHGSAVKVVSNSHLRVPAHPPASTRRTTGSPSAPGRGLWW